MSPDRDVYAHSRRNLGDLRIIEKTTNKEIPYKLIVERGEQRRSAVTITINNLSHTPDEYTSFTANLGLEGALHNEIEIFTSTKNFQRPVIIEGSVDQKHWVILTEQAHIHKLSVEEQGFMDSHTRILYPISTVPYLRIRIIDKGEPPLAITGANVYYTLELPPVETNWPTSILEQVENTNDKTSELIVDLGVTGIPTTRISIETQQKNFHRRARLENSNDGKIWNTLLNSDVFYAYDTPLFLGTKLSVQHPEVTTRYLKIIIFNEDNPPLPITKTQSSGFLRKIIFTPKPGSSYDLYYGSAKATAPSYDLDQIFPYLVTENLPHARLDNAINNTLFMKPDLPFTERHPWLLPSSVGILSLMIGVFLAQLFRQIQTFRPPPSE